MIKKMTVDDRMMMGDDDHVEGIERVDESGTYGRWELAV
jgi:hypothetical protein